MGRKAGAKEKQTEAEESGELVRYELGYHLVPFITEEALPTEVGHIREIIERSGGISTADQFPTARPLAYEIARMTAGKRQTYTQSYFGWIQFELVPSALAEVKLALDGNDRILRLIIVRAKREIPLASRTASIVQPLEETPSLRDEKPVVKASESSPVLTDEELDKTIEELVIE